MGQGDMSPNIYEGGTSMVMSPNILEFLYFAARFILSSNSNNCCLLYFNANSFTKKLQLLGPPTEAPPLDPTGGLPSPRPKSSFMSPHIIM